MKQSEMVGAIVGSGDNKSSGMEKYNYLKNIRELTHVRRRRQTTAINTMTLILVGVLTTAKCVFSRQYSSLAFQASDR
jgi:hypothetical protein